MNKEERRAYERERYARMKDTEGPRIKANRANSVAKAYEYVNLIKSEPCTDCGECFHPVAMQFDHIGTDKEYNVSDMCQYGYGISSIQAEIDKCELVCANCHAVRTWKRNNG